jgi:hypothetical protein
VGIYLHFIFICVFLADPSQPFFHGGTPSYGEAYRREKAGNKGWGKNVVQLLIIIFENVYL